MTANQLQTAIDAIAQLVAFAEDGDGDLVKLAELGQGMVMRDAAHALRALRPAERERLREDVRAFLYAAAGRPDLDYLKATTIRPELVPFLGKVRQGMGRERRLFGVNGSPRDVLVYQVATFLAVVGEERLHFCPAPDCGRLFVKVTKKRFCSQRCQSRIYMRQLRADERAERDALTKGARHGKPTRKR